MDLTGKSGEVTVAVSVGGDHFITGDTVFTVISSIEAPVEIVTDNDGVKSANIAPRGGSGTATFTFKEGFPSAFMAEDGDEVRLQILNVPEKAKLMLSLAEAGTTFQEGSVHVGDTTLLPPAAAVADTDDIMGMDAMDATTHTVTGTGETINLTIMFGGDDDEGMPLDPNTAIAETLALSLTLVVTADIEDLTIPLLGPDVRVQVTMRPQDDEMVPYFVENYVPAGGAVVFSFTPAKCTLLFQYGAVLPNTMPAWDTAFAITNPTGFPAGGIDPLSGSIKFTLFPNGGEMMEYEMSRELSAGNTLAMNLSEILEAVPEWSGGNFQGHFFVEANFTPCEGLGWVTDYEGVNQAYTPIQWPPAE